MRKMLLNTIAGISLVTAAAAASGETCYQLSKDGNTWNRTPEQLCIETTATDNNATKTKITLQHGLWEINTVATFDLELIGGLRCGPDCNGNIYGISSPSNSIFNSLKVSFNGRTTIDDEGNSIETGTVSIGETKFYYRK